jgi:hypothetical protein
LVFTDDVSEEKWVKEASVFNRNLRQQLSVEDKEKPKEALNPGNNPFGTNPVRSSSTDATFSLFSVLRFDLRTSRMQRRCSPS